MGTNRRNRDSRRRKDAKKRRDARHGQRKWAAYLLDEQFSTRMNEALSQSDVYAPPAYEIRPSPPVRSSVPVSEMALPDCVVRRGPSPHQLPVLALGGPDTADFPDLLTPRLMPLSTPPRRHERIPNWCPLVPNRNGDNIWSGGFPTFYDLSGLPEPLEPAPPVSRYDGLYLWRSPLDGQSRLFPHTPPSHPTVARLPNSRCMTQEPGDASQPSTSSFRDPRSVPTNITEAVEKAVGIASSELALGDGNAANLWHILMNTPLEGEPTELEGSEVPYVHSNSLVGLANYHASQRVSENHNASADSTDSVAVLANLGLLEEALSSRGQHACDSSTITVGTKAGHYDAPMVPPPPFRGLGDSSTLGEGALVSVLEYAHTVQECNTTSSASATLVPNPETWCHVAGAGGSDLREEPLFMNSKLSNRARSVRESAKSDHMGNMQNFWCPGCDGNPTLVDGEDPDFSDSCMVYLRDECQYNLVIINDHPLQARALSEASPRIASPQWDDFFPSRPYGGAVMVNSPSHGTPAALDNLEEDWVLDM